MKRANRQKRICSYWKTISQIIYGLKNLSFIVMYKSPAGAKRSETPVGWTGKLEAVDLLICLGHDNKGLPVYPQIASQNFPWNSKWLNRHPINWGCSHQISNEKNQLDPWFFYWWILTAREVAGVFEACPSDLYMNKYRLLIWKPHQNKSLFSYRKNRF